MDDVGGGGGSSKYMQTVVAEAQAPTRPTSTPGTTATSSGGAPDTVTIASIDESSKYQAGANNATGNCHIGGDVGDGTIKHHANQQQQQMHAHQQQQHQQHHHQQHHPQQQQAHHQQQHHAQYASAVSGSGCHSSSVVDDVVVVADQNGLTTVIKSEDGSSTNGVGGIGAAGISHSYVLPSFLP